MAAQMEQQKAGAQGNPEEGNNGDLKLQMCEVKLQMCEVKLQMCELKVQLGELMQKVMEAKEEIKEEIAMGKKQRIWNLSDQQDVGWMDVQVTLAVGLHFVVM